jgi:hypothetical protein
MPIRFTMYSNLQDHSPAVLVGLGFACLYLLVRFVQYGLVARRRSIFARQNGCQPVPKYPHKEPIFGLDMFWENIKLSKNGGVLEELRLRYKMMGVNTYTHLILGDRNIMTCEPENIKAVLATQFKDFDLPPRRKDAFAPIFGRGIFTTDGHEWEASRALLRPSFIRSQVGDIETFEHHISKLIARIPRDGSTVDLQKLFFMLTLDSVTDFLFGESTNVLEENDPKSPGNKFGDAFDYTTERVGLA